MTEKSNELNDSRIRSELKNLIGFSMGRDHADKLVEIIRSHPEWHELIIDIYLSDEEPYSRKIAWAIDLYAEEDPDFVIPYREEIAGKLASFSHPALKRHGLHILSRIPLPEENLGTLANLCFEWLLEPGLPAAIKVYSMEVLFRITLTEPDLRKELADCIEIRLSEETPGFRNRGEKILKKLSKEGK